MKTAFHLDEPAVMLDEDGLSPRRTGLRCSMKTAFDLDERAFESFVETAFELDERAFEST